MMIKNTTWGFRQIPAQGTSVETGLDESADFLLEHVATAQDQLTANITWDHRPCLHREKLFLKNRIITITRTFHLKISKLLKIDIKRRNRRSLKKLYCTVPDISFPARRGGLFDLYVDKIRFNLSIEEWLAGMWWSCVRAYLAPVTSRRSISLTARLIRLQSRSGLFVCIRPILNCS